MQHRKATASLFHPRLWPTWLAISILYLMTKLPYSWQLNIGRCFGYLMYFILKRKRHITRMNIQHCFPELNDEQQQKLVKDTFLSVGIAISETAMSWFMPSKRLKNLANIEGLEHINNALAKGNGIILLGAHYTTIDICGRIAALNHSFYVTYREQSNAVINYLLSRRERHNLKIIHRHDLRKFINALKNNEIVWYAGDQDYGPKHSIFAPFFNISSATISAFLRLAEKTHASIIPLSHYRLANNKGYKIILHPPLRDIPSGDITHDLSITNQLLEQQIRKHPEQYLWLHRRFKTRPKGEASFYD